MAPSLLTWCAVQEDNQCIACFKLFACNIAHAKNPHTVVKQLALGCTKEMARLIVREDISTKIDDISDI